jgi:hypothetical protein
MLWRTVLIDICLSLSPKSGKIMQSLQYVSELFNVNTDNTYYDSAEDGQHHFTMNENNRMLWKVCVYLLKSMRQSRVLIVCFVTLQQSAESLGYVAEKIPRNVKKCVDCGHCGSGCSHKSKQSTWNALLEPILLAQARSEQDDDRTKPAAGKLYVIPDCYVDCIVFADADKTKAIGLEATACIYSEKLSSQGLGRELITKRCGCFIIRS